MHTPGGSDLYADLCTCPNRPLRIVVWWPVAVCDAPRAPAGPSGANNLNLGIGECERQVIIEGHEPIEMKIKLHTFN